MPSGGYAYTGPVNREHWDGQTYRLLNAPGVYLRLPKVGDKDIEGDKGGGSLREGDKGEKKEENRAPLACSPGVERGQEGREASNRRG